MPLSLHHIGVLVPDIGATAAEYVARYGYELRSAVIHDPVQTAFVQFLRLPGDVTMVELVSPDRPESKLSNALRKGGGLNHLCYATDDIEGSLASMTSSAGMMVVQPPVAAAAFPGRRIAWLVGRDLIPVELVERGGVGEL